MAATDFGTLFLDARLRIKRFTDQVTELFAITPSDEGRPITDFAHQLDYDDLIKDVRSVLADLAPVRREIKSRRDRWFDVRMRPYRTVDDRIEGVVLTFVDITERRQAEETLRLNAQQLHQQKQLIDLSREPVFVWDFDNGIIDWNRGCEEFYGYSRAEAQGRRPHDLLGHDPVEFVALSHQLLTMASWSGERTQKTKNGSEVTVESRLQLESFDGRKLVLESTHDITQRKLWETRQAMLLNELSHRVKNTLAVVQAIAHQTLRTTSSSQTFVERFDGRLIALARAHDWLMQSNWQGADLALMARDLLAPYVGDDAKRVRLDGDAVALPPDIATPFGLVLHELAVNAARYGALSVINGSVDIRWNISAGQPRILQFVWQERDGPKTEPPSHAGLGSRLIETAIPDSSVTRSFEPQGLICTIRVPLTGVLEDLSPERHA